MEVVDFPPFYTIQPVEATREKQLELWRQVILKDCQSSFVLDVATFPAFSNSKINRSLDTDDRRTVCESLVMRGFANWEDPKTKTRLRVYSKTPDAWASIVYDWAKMARAGGEISTLFEIRAGDDISGTELEGIHEEVLYQALKILERQGKAQLFGEGSTKLDELGVKFLGV